VLQIVSPPPRSREGRIGVCGPERRAANLAAQWRSHGIQPVVCYPRRGNLHQNFIDAGVEVVDFEIGSKLDLMAVRRIARLARETAAELIHTQGPASLDLLASLGSRAAGVPFVMTRPVVIEDQVNYSPFRRRVYGAIDRAITLRIADRIIAVSNAGLRHLLGFCGVQDAKVRLVHNGINLSRFATCSSSPASGQFNTRPVVIGMVAQLIPIKAWPDFVEVICMMRRMQLNVKGLVVGDGEMREELERDVLARGMEAHFNFTGHTEDVSSVYAQMDVFLFTSRGEGLSVAVIEAMASGLPIVATDVGGIREQVEHGLNGYVVQPGDLSAMVFHCADLARDPKRRAYMGKLTRQLAEDRFSEHRMLKEYVHCYREVASPKAITRKQRDDSAQV
jgi:L-malate glycosyltransferase